MKPEDLTTEVPAAPHNPKDVDCLARVLDAIDDGIVVVAATAIPSPGAHNPSGTTDGTMDDDASSAHPENSYEVDGSLLSGGLSDEIVALRFAWDGGDDVAHDLPTIDSSGGPLATMDDDDAHVKTAEISFPSPKEKMEPSVEDGREGGGGGAAVAGRLAVKPSPGGRTNDDVTLEGPNDAKRARILEAERPGKNLDDSLNSLNEVRMSLLLLYSVFSRCPHASLLTLGFHYRAFLQQYWRNSGTKNL
jgi:hypothetical protein